MKKIIFVLLLLPLLSVHCNPKTKPQEEFYKIAFQRIDNQQLKITITLNPKSHLYLDVGERKNYFPISYRWGKNNIYKPKEISRPQGVFDSEQKVHILKGEGSFIFSHDKMSQIKQIDIRTQICDEISNVCYRPLWNTHTIEV